MNIWLKESEVALSSKYDREYYEGHEGPGRRDDDVSGPPLLTLLESIAPTGRLLSIGCSYGYFLQKAEARYETYGVDISKYAIKRATGIASRSTVGVVDIESRESLLRFVGKGRFDVIVSFSTLEHLRDPHSVLETIHYLLIPGGYLFLKVPKRDSLRHRLFSLLGKEDELEICTDDTHHSLLTASEWIEAVGSAGFEFTNLPTIPTMNLKRWVSERRAWHRFFFLRALPFLGYLNDCLHLLCRKPHGSIGSNR